MPKNFDQANLLSQTTPFNKKEQKPHSPPKKPQNKAEQAEQVEQVEQVEQPKKKVITFTTTLYPDERNLIKALAEEFGVSQREIIMAAINEKFSDQKKNEEILKRHNIKKPGKITY